MEEFRSTDSKGRRSQPAEFGQAARHQDKRSRTDEVGGIIDGAGHEAMGILPRNVRADPTAGCRNVTLRSSGLSHVIGRQMRQPDSSPDQHSS
jgi:hypothetical protein